MINGGRSQPAHSTRPCAGFFIALGMAVSACSYTPHKEDLAQVGDVATTALAESSGHGEEANPVAKPLVDAGPAGYVLLLGIKLGLNHWIRTMPADECNRILRFHTSLGWGLTGNNALIAFDLVSAAALPVGMAIGLIYWFYADPPCDEPDRPQDTESPAETGLFFAPR